MPAFGINEHADRSGDGLRNPQTSWMIRNPDVLWRIRRRFPQGFTRIRYEDEIEANALADPDNPTWTVDELANAWSPAETRETRSRLNMTQEAVSETFQIPLGTLRDWERGVSSPDTSAQTLLRVVAREPEAVLRALAG